MRKPFALFTAVLVMILAGSGSQPARADAKSEFQKGCESGHGSYVENQENVQCNTSGGVTITCDYKITHCAVSAQAIYTKPIQTTAKALQEYLTGKARIDAPHGWKLVKTENAKANAQGAN
jgi:hypothetical protein